MNVRAVHADAVFLGEGAPLRDGAVVVDGTGTLVHVGPAAEVLPRHAGVPSTRIAGVLVPGLVNAHTHLELSALRGKVAGGAGFVPWVDRLVAARSEEPPEDDRAAIERAVHELHAAGTVAVGEITNSLVAAPLLARASMAGIVFWEAFGLDDARALARIDTMRTRLDEEAFGWASDDLVPSVAPHTLYTTHPRAVAALVALARSRGTRSSVHLAEHPAERAFLAHGGGPFADFARRRGLSPEAFPAPGCDPIEAAARSGVLAPDVLAVHLTDARRSELDRVAAAGAPVVVCPRSNLFIEVRLPPLTAMLEAGIVPALGTDSLASNRSLDVLAEAKALAERFPGIASMRLLEMATAAGARALGRTDFGRIARGTRPGLVAIEGSLPADADACAWALRQPLSARRWVVARGGRA